MEHTIQKGKFKLPDPFLLRDSAVRHSLDHWPQLYKLSDEELQRQFNGVGPDRWPEDLRLMLSEILEDVLEAVEVHDADYAIGGTEEDFHEANKILGKNVRRLARKKYPWWKPRRLFLIEVSYIMTDVTDKYGWEGWNKR